MERKHVVVRLLLALLMIGASLSDGPIPAAAAGPNLALGKTVVASSSNGPYTAANINDGNQATYWESANNAFPQWLQVDLGSAQSAGRIVLQLPAGWGQRWRTTTDFRNRTSQSLRCSITIHQRLVNKSVPTERPFTT